MRWRHFRRAWWAAVRRWGAYALVAAAVFGAGSNAPLMALASLPVVLLAPLGQAADALAQIAAGAPGGARAVALPAVAQALAWIATSAALGALPLWLTRRWWRPGHWRAAERALPLDAADLRRSDAAVARRLVLPVHALLAVGVALLAVAGGRTAWVSMLMTTAGWAAGVAGSWALAMATLARTRPGHALPDRAARGQTSAQRGHAGAAASNAAPTAAGKAAVKAGRGPWAIWRALVWWPLRRGVAIGSARLLAGFGVTTPALAAGPMVAPEATGWWLAALSLAALAGTALTRRRIAIEWARWRRAARALPITPRAWPWGEAALSLLPVGLGAGVAGAVLGVVLQAGSTASAAAGPVGQAALAPTIRPAVLAAYLLALLLGCAWTALRAGAAGATGRAGASGNTGPAGSTGLARSVEDAEAVAHAAEHTPANDPSAMAAVWLLVLVVCMALGSEVRVSP